MVPVIALVGRPNVGKSTIFNRLTRSRDAIVADLPGLTRDRKYGEGQLEDRRFIVIDTGGISGDEDGIDAVMAAQSMQAIDEADIVFFVVDARAGLTGADEMIAKHLRIKDKKTWLVINKIDGLDPDVATLDFYSLGMSDIRLTAAAHNRGTRSLIEEVLKDHPIDESEADADLDSKGVRIGIIGRPNVGKSTLVNRLLGEERVVVFDEAGTTRDSIYIPYERRDQPYTLIDTAGVRRRKNITESVEKFSIIQTLQAIEDANVVVIVIDAREGVVEQDLHLIGFAMDAGRALLIAVNKWDGMNQDDKNSVKRELDRRLDFLDYAPIHFISAKHGTGVGDLYKSIDQGYESAFAKWSTNRLTELLIDVVSDHQPPMVRARRIKLRYAHQGGSNPPIIIVHGTKTSDIPDSYKRYLENAFRKILKIKCTPIRFQFKSSDNPYSKPTHLLSEKERVKKVRKFKTKEYGTRRGKNSTRNRTGKNA